MIEAIPEMTVRHENGYEVTRSPLMWSRYDNGCLVERRQLSYTVIGKCGRTVHPKWHETWRKC